MKNLILVRGLPGSGKTTVARLFSDALCFAADDYFYDENSEYNFDHNLLPLAHDDCRMRVEKCLHAGHATNYVVHNTSTTEREIAAYKNIAEKHSANFISIVVENRHGNKSVHGVPEISMTKMRNRFSVKL